MISENKGLLYVVWNCIPAVQHVNFVIHTSINCLEEELLLLLATAFCHQTEDKERHFTFSVLPQAAKSPS